MLDGRYPSEEFGELRARIVWDRVAGVRARKGARELAIANAGTIPTGASTRSPCPTGRRVGSSTRRWSMRPGPAQAFLLGASTWRIEEITRPGDRRPGSRAPGAVPSGRATRWAPEELGEAIGAFSRWAVEQPAETLEQGVRPRSRRRGEPAGLPAGAAGSDHGPAEQRTIVLERFRTRSATGGYASSRLRRPRPRRLGARPSGADARALRSRLRPDLVRTTGSSCTSPTSMPRTAEALPRQRAAGAGPRRGGAGDRLELAARLCSGPLPRERGPGAADPARLPGRGRRCGNSG